MDHDEPTGVAFAALVAASGANMLLAGLALVALTVDGPVDEENLLVLIALGVSYALFLVATVLLDAVCLLGGRRLSPGTWAWLALPLAGPVALVVL